MKAFSTIIEAKNKSGQMETFDGPPIFAEDLAAAVATCDRHFPYASVLEEDVNMQKMSDKLFNNPDL